MLQVLVSGLVTMALYGAVVLGVVKIFQIATELGEIKDACYSRSSGTRWISRPLRSHPLIRPEG